jgi:hypothetical protein
MAHGMIVPRLHHTLAVLDPTIKAIHYEGTREDIADTEIAVQALAELQASGGHPEQAGWLAWNDIVSEL